MAKYVSSRNTISARALKRKTAGSVVVLHYGRVDIKFARVHGGWLRSRTDVTSERSDVVSSAVVADECNHAVGCADSWAKVY